MRIELQTTWSAKEAVENMKINIIKDIGIITVAICEQKEIKQS